MPSAAPDPLDRIVWALDDFARATAIEPRAGLSQRVAARVAQEPRSTAPRRFIAALLALDPSASVRALRQCLRASIEPGPHPSMLRLQAALVVFIVFATLSSGAVAGLAGAGAVISQLTHGPSEPAPAPLLQASPSPSPSLPPVAEPSDRDQSRAKPAEVKKPRATATPRALIPSRSSAGTKPVVKKPSVKAGSKPRAEDRSGRDEGRKETPEPTETPEHEDDDHEGGSGG